jgi:hypothetical protein
MLQKVNPTFLKAGFTRKISTVHVRDHLLYPDLAHGRDRFPVRLLFPAVSVPGPAHVAPAVHAAGPVRVQPDCAVEEPVDQALPVEHFHHHAVVAVCVDSPEHLVEVVPGVVVLFVSRVEQVPVLSDFSTAVHADALPCHGVGSDNSDYGASVAAQRLDTWFLKTVVDM